MIIALILLNSIELVCDRKVLIRAIHLTKMGLKIVITKQTNERNPAVAEV